MYIYIFLSGNTKFSFQIEVARLKELVNVINKDNARARKVQIVILFPARSFLEPTQKARPREREIHA